MLALIAFAPGCGGEVENVEDEGPVIESIRHPVKVIIVDAESMAEPIARQWAAQTNGEIETITISSTELFADDYAVISDADVLVYPSILLAHLVADEMISKLPDEVWNSDELANRGFLKDCRRRMIRFGRDRWATPLSHPYNLMFIRKDLLDKAGARVPRTWSELVELQGMLVGVEGENLPTEIAIPASGEQAALSMLAIAAVEVRHRGKLDSVFRRADMKPLIAAEPYVIAMETLVNLVGNKQRLSATQTAKNYFDGKTAIAIGRPAKASFLDSTDVPEFLYENTIVTRVPGSKRWFDFSKGKWNEIVQGAARVELKGAEGYQASILKTAAYPTQVFSFLEWLSSKSTTTELLSGSELGSPSRYSQLGDIQSWTGDVLSVENSDRYIEIVTELNNENVAMNFPRVRGSREYLQKLAEGVEKCLAGDGDPQKTLAEVAKQWEAITDKYGRDEQVELLRNDLGF